MSAATEYADLEGLEEWLPDEVALEAEECRRHFALFAQRAWHVVEPGVPLLWGRLQDAISEHLQAVTEGQIQDLLINVRPRSSKSRLVSVLWPAWEWIRKPTTRWLTASHELSLSRNLSRVSLQLVRSPWYRQRWGHLFSIRRDLNAPSHFGNTRGGERQITANRAGVTGKGGERLLWDDPHDAKKRGSKADLEAAREFLKAFSTRRNNAKTDAMVVIGQRVAASDIFATLIAEGGRVLLKLPTRFKASSPCRTSIGYVDPRTEEGQYLDEDRHGPAEDQRARVELGPQDYAAQHDQDPSPEGGTTFRLADFRRWRFVDEHLVRGVELPEQDEHGRRVELLPRPGHRGEEWGRYFDDLLWSWDFTFKGTSDSDWVVGQLWGRLGPRFYMLHQVRAHLDFTACLSAVIQASALYPVVYSQLVEAAANGPGIVSMLQQHLLGLELVGTGGKGKPERARAVSPLTRAGAVYVPENEVGWGEFSTVPGYLQEMQEFPGGSHDDQVDATSQALSRLFEAYRQWLASTTAATGQPPPENPLTALLNALGPAA